ncbi:LysR family transcriptional regulator [Cognatishimia sp. 1_MG-2023]|uniref:LysR family transcriptional regulator n=1 Tax=Cognatishimia sp. 1_MG-2023 TaxID=3062642 RepID=UPI0026E36520|nr:LysR family transcriptional regulator [Cognatishimia sp. 1_MG-2023]MDO6728241.1 LysR family transcriptional regulator [Cognatishimia sp. 1_MG-2023]
MSRNHFGDIKIFVEVARLGGFRAAAEHLKMAPASVSEAVQRFEDRLDVRLFERSTRSVVLTPLGESFFEKSLPAVKDLELAMRDIDDQKDQVSGVLRLSAPYSAGPFFLDELVARFASQHTNVDVEVIFDDKKVDLLNSGIDAAIRSSSFLEPDTHAIPVGPELNMCVVASQDYLQAKGTPLVPRDILHHDTICYAFGRGDKIAPWGFTGAEGAFTIQPKPRMVANDMRSLLNYAQHGLGLAYVYAEIAAPYIQNGSVTEVLAEHLMALPRYSLNYRSKKLMARRLRAFIDLARTGETQD